MSSPQYNSGSNNTGSQSLTSKQVGYLRSLAHHRKTVVIVGNEGASDAVLAEIDGALDYHELVKVKLMRAKKIDRQKLLAQICDKTHANKVQLIGRIGTIYRTAETPRIQLPAA